MFNSPFFAINRGYQYTRCKLFSGGESCEFKEPVVHTEKNIEPTWLAKTYESKKNRTFLLGKQAIDSLIQNGERVSYRSISAKSKELDIDGKGIHPNTIKSNPELHLYYLLHFNSKSPLKKKAIIEL